jgi:hypothetical protein
MNYKLLSRYLEQSISVALKLIDLLFINQGSSCISGSQNEIDKLRITLYHRIVLISESLLKLLPISPEERFSLTSIGSLTRVIVESYRPFYYLTIEDIKGEERDFRYLLFEVYLLIERRNMIEAIKKGSKDPVLEAELVDMKQKIINHSYYQFLSNAEKIKTIYDELCQSIRDSEKDGPKRNIGFANGFMDKLVQRNGCCKDDKTILLERLAVYKSSGTFSNEERNNMGDRFNKFFSKLMSNYVHSSAFAISMEHDSNFQLNQEVENYLNQMVSCCIFYVVTATYDLLNLYSLSEKDTLTIECEETEKGVFFFLAILTGNSTSAETQP